MVRTLGVHLHPDTVRSARIQAVLRWLRDCADDVFGGLNLRRRPMFSDDLAEQTEKVPFAVGAVVGQTHDLDACREMTRDLALRHVADGVERSRYDTVGRAVMEMLEQALGPELTPDAAAAWRRAYASIAAAMVDAAYGAPAAA